MSEAMFGYHIRGQQPTMKQIEARIRSFRIRQLRMMHGAKHGAFDRDLGEAVGRLIDEQLVRLAARTDEQQRIFNQRDLENV